MQQSRLPRMLLRLTNLAIALLVVAVVLAVVVVVVAAVTGPDARLKVPVQFVPDRGSYQLTSDLWGEGVIEEAQGWALFEDPGPALFVGSAAAGVAVFVVPGFVVLLLLRRIFKTMVGGSPFVWENVRRIRWIGWLTLAFGVLGQFAWWGLVLFVRGNVDAVGVDMSVRVDSDLVRPDLALVFFGLVVLALAEVFRHGARLQTESDLTV